MIRCENLSKAYCSGRGSVQALSGISLRVETGQAAAVVGKSGSGKSTLLNCLGGLERCDSGKVIAGETDMTALSAESLSVFVRRNVGFVFQFGSLFSYLNVFENIAFPMVLNGAGRKQQRLRTSELLERIGLPGAGEAMPYELSGGEVQRVAVARALAHCPRILLADEPTASLDTATGLELITLMFTLGRDQSCTMIYTTHDSELIEVADQVLRLRDGRMESGS